MRAMVRGRGSRRSYPTAGTARTTCDAIASCRSGASRDRETMTATPSRLSAKAGPDGMSLKQVALRLRSSRLGDTRRTRLQLPAAVGTYAAQGTLHAVDTEGAFVAADQRRRAVGRQSDVAAFALRFHFEHAGGLGRSGCVQGSARRRPRRPPPRELRRAYSAGDWRASCPSPGRRQAVAVICVKGLRRSTGASWQRSYRWSCGRAATSAPLSVGAA